MEPIGHKLKSAREKLKMSSSDVARAIKSKTQYVEAIENNEFHKLIAPVYAKGFIKLYAQCVQLDPAPLLRQFNSTEGSEEHTSPKQELPVKKEAPPARKPRHLSALTTLINAFRKIKLPNIRPVKLPAFKPVALPAARWLLVITAVAICLVILPVIVRHIRPSNTKIRVPPAGRWIAEPPEPYLNIPTPKTQNNR